MIDLYTAVENWSLSIWVRESGSLLAYPTILFLHTVGLSIVVGLSAALSLRALGVGREVPVPPLERFFPLLWAGFWVNAGSGLLLLIADATTKMTNPVFYVKIVFIALAMTSTLLLKRALFRRGGAGAPVLGALSLFFWIGAITAGRLMAYLGPVSGVPGLNNTL